MANAFVERIVAGGGNNAYTVQDALKPALEEERDLRVLYATDRSNAKVAQHPYAGLIDVFGAPEQIRLAHPRVVDHKSQEELEANYVFPLSKDVRKTPGEQATVPSLQEFERNWSVFSEGSLVQLSAEDWQGVVAAGGSVLACMEPLSEKNGETRRAMRKWYHSQRFPTSDVDLFLWGMNKEQAEAKIVKIYEAVRDSVPWEVTCVRTKHTVSIHSQYPYRSVQIVLRLYSSPAEILAGFDVDSACILYDGSLYDGKQGRVWASARGMAAMMTQCNRVDMSRRSPSYEIRLSKYARRGYEVHVPTLSRADIDPCIYERAINSVTGLARLLVLEKISSGEQRSSFLDARRKIRGRPQPLQRYSQYNRRKQRRYKGDLKQQVEFAGLEMNDYDVAQLHIPYGPGWNARRIEKLVYQTDLGMNSTFNPKNKGRRLHRHPAFFGTGSECLDDCCETCPEPIDEDEKTLYEEESEHYITGRVSFMESDPGRQMMTGSFRPIDEGEWSEQVYVGPTQKLFNAISEGDLNRVNALIEGEVVDVNRRDHVGRTALHFAILSRQSEIALMLVEKGARITARLVDGRTSLHVAVQMDLLDVVRGIMEKNKENEAIEKAKAEGTVPADDKEESKERVRDSSEDDWSSVDEGVASLDDEDEDDGDDEDSDEGSEEGGKRKAQPQKDSAAEQQQPGEVPNDDETNATPDILDINLPDWDFSFSPLSYAVLFASPGLVKFLIESGADVKMSTKGNYEPAPTIHPLSLTAVRDNQGDACEIVDILLKAGASSSYADASLDTIFHKAVSSRKFSLVRTYLERDESAKKVALDFPKINGSRLAVFPLVTAISQGDWSMVALLLSEGAKVEITDEEFKHVAVIDQLNKLNWRKGSKISNSSVSPFEAALASNSLLVHLLVKVGANVNKLTQYSLGPYAQEQDNFLDYIVEGIKEIDEEIQKQEVRLTGGPTAAQGDKYSPFPQTTFQNFLREQDMKKDEPIKGSWTSSWEEKRKREDQEKLNALYTLRPYFAEVEATLKEHGVKRYSDVLKEQGGKVEEESNNNGGAMLLGGGGTRRSRRMHNSDDKLPKRQGYSKMGARYSGDVVSDILAPAYDELFEAAYTGDKIKIMDLCLPMDDDQTKKREHGPLQIATELTNSQNVYSHGCGITPLTAAILGRQWETAKLIVSIATAQHDPDMKDEMFKAGAFDLDDDSDDGDTASYDSDATTGKKEVAELVNVAQAAQVVKSEASPKKLIHETKFSLPKSHGNLLDTAVQSGDMDALKVILEFYTAKNSPIAFEQSALNAIVNKDRPDMLDELIRKSGLGLPTPGGSGEEDGEAELEPLAVNDYNRVYLGLNVHGKKRKDLASKEKHSPAEPDFKPLVWWAIRSGSTKILEWLSDGEKTLAAYQAFALANPESWLARVKVDLSKVLPKWLGWSVTANGESPLTAAVLSRDVAIFKKVVQMASKDITSTMHDVIPVTGHNLVMIITEGGLLSNKDTSLVEHLLNIGVSPAERDSVRGWNIFHIMCDKRMTWDLKLLRLYLAKLPKDVVSALLEQTSKHRLDTPLHLAIREAQIEVVKLLIPFIPQQVFLTGNVNGFTPLTLAVHHGFSEIVQLLLDACPSAIAIENTVGQTATDVTLLKDVLAKVQSQQSNTIGNHTIQLFANLNFLHDARNSVQKNASILEESAKLRATVATLQESAKLDANGDLNKALQYLLEVVDKKELEKVEKDIGRDATKAANEPDEDGARFDPPNHSKALEVLKPYLADAQSSRKLVHLADVQRAAQYNLSLAKQGKNVDEDDAFYQEDEGPKDGLWSTLVYKDVIAKRIEAETELGKGP